MMMELILVNWTILSPSFKNAESFPTREMVHNFVLFQIYKEKVKLGGFVNSFTTIYNPHSFHVITNRKTVNIQ